MNKHTIGRMIMQHVAGVGGLREHKRRERVLLLTENEERLERWHG
mgnify:CR=1 FL=1